MGQNRRRRKAKEKMLNAKLLRQVKLTQQRYKGKEKEVKRIVRKDKRNFIESLACEAEQAAEKREFRKCTRLQSSYAVTTPITPCR